MKIKKIDKYLYLDSAYNEHDDRVVNFNPSSLHSSRGQGGYRNSSGSHYRGSYRPNYSAEVFRHPDDMRKYGNKAKHNRKSHGGRGVYSRSNRGECSSAHYQASILLLVEMV